MRNDLKIRTLTERFFDGETSLAEEQELYRLYREGDVPEDLLQYKELFGGFEGLFTEGMQIPYGQIERMRERFLA